MTTLKSSTKNRRGGRSVRNAALAAAAVLSLGTIWMSTGGSAGADRTDAPVEQTELHHTPEFDAAIARFAQSRGLSGLSPANLSSVAPAQGCHGLSLASATGCTAGELAGHSRLTSTAS